MKKITLVIITFLFFTFSFNAQNIYVTPDGTAQLGDAGAGTQSNPYNLDYVVDTLNGVLVDGVTLFLEGNFQRDSSIFIFGIDNLTIKSSGLGASLIATDNLASGGNIYMMIIRSSSNLRIEDVSFIGTGLQRNTAFTLLSLGDNNNALVNNVTFENNRGDDGVALEVFGSAIGFRLENSIVRNLGWSTIYDDDPIHVIGQDANGDDIEDCYGASGVVIKGNRNGGPLSDVIIRNNSFTNLVTGCNESLTLTGNIENFTVEDNFFSNNKNIGIAIAGHYDLYDPDDLSVLLQPQYNQARNGIVRNNTVIASVSDVATSAGIYCDGCKDVVIERNLVKESGAGVSIGCENGGGLTASNVSVINNVFKNNIDAGAFLGSSLNTNNDIGAAQSSVVNCTIRNNTFYKNGTNSSVFANQEVFLGRSDTNIIRNNIFYIDNNSMGVVSSILIDDDGNPTFQNVSNLTLDHNLYYKDNNFMDNLVVSSSGNPLPFPQDAQYGDPEFMNPMMDNFDISLTSRAVNTGNSSGISSGEFDYGGSTRIFGATNVDIGAYETTSTVTPQPSNLSVDDTILNNSIAVYPNPVKDKLILRIDNNFFGLTEVRIYSITGSLIKADITFEKNQQLMTQDIDCTNLTTGVYVLDINTNNISKKVKIIKN